MTRSLLLVGNWKMNHGPRAARTFCADFERHKLPTHVRCWIAPPFSSLAALQDHTSLIYGAQNVHWAAEGAFTGEVNADSLIELGCSFVICGHSERRNLFGENDESAAKRAEAAITKGLNVVFCVGETSAERNSGHTQAALQRQLAALSANTLGSNKAKLIIAYEPIWAVGTDRTPNIREIEAAHASIQKFLAGRGKSEVDILYGGSVNTSNIAEICAVTSVAGALVGRASLEPDSFAELAKILA
ncbi:MAG: triose-phosphate isomerase [Oligoflexia bacterium]|nr:triose-phosphate isomerase [Oligoflexia bacterium]